MPIKQIDYGSKEYMQMVAQFGDSLSKESGNDTIYVFRENDSGNYVQIYPSKQNGASR